MSTKPYQVALSFAGEQRPYVEEVARHLDAHSVAVFYDRFEEAYLWGKSGAEAFHSIFCNQSDYTVMFVSEEYVRKSWPRHERRSAFSRMLEEEREYILPVRFDDAVCEGLPNDVIFEDARRRTPAEIASLIARKLGASSFSGKASDVPPPWLAAATGVAALDYKSFDGRFAIGSGEWRFETKRGSCGPKSVYLYNDPPSTNGVALSPRSVGAIAEVEDAMNLDFTSRRREVPLGRVAVLKNTSGSYAAVRVAGLNTDAELRTSAADLGLFETILILEFGIQVDGSDSFGEGEWASSSRPWAPHTIPGRP